MENLVSMLTSVISTSEIWIRSTFTIATQVQPAKTQRVLIFAPVQRVTLGTATSATIPTNA